MAKRKLFAGPQRQYPNKKNQKSKHKKQLVKPKKKPRVKKPPKKKKPKVINKKKVVQHQVGYDPNKWIVVTFLKNPQKVFFPSNIFPEYLNANRMLYEEAKKKPLDFWNDKCVIFHMADKDRMFWLPFYKDIINNSKVCWVKFVAGVFMTDMVQLDLRRYRDVPLSFYRVIDDHCHNILWELPLDYEGFWYDKNIVPLTLYDKKYEVPIEKKSIDFLAVIDNRLYYNYIKTLELMRRLAEAGYKVKVILVKGSQALWRNYTKKKIGVETIPNNKDEYGRNVFYNLCKEAKIMVDLSFRWTYGRVVYEALFNGALSICPHTYGASYHLFPDLIVDTSNFSINDVYKKCVDLVGKWSPKMVKDYRHRAQKYASPQAFVKNLNKKTKELMKK